MTQVSRGRRVTRSGGSLRIGLADQLAGRALRASAQVMMICEAVSISKSGIVSEPFICQCSRGIGPTAASSSPVCVGTGVALKTLGSPRSLCGELLELGLGGQHDRSALAADAEELAVGADHRGVDLVASPSIRSRSR